MKEPLRAQIALNQAQVILTKIAIKAAKRILPEPIKKWGRRFLNRRHRDAALRSGLHLDEILVNLQRGKDYREILIFPPSLDWNVQLFQRPQQLALALARRGALVFYLQPNPNPRHPPFELLGERIYLCNVPIETFQLISRPLIYLLTWNSDYGACFDNPRVIYDFVDDIDVFYGDQEKIAQGHRSLLQKAEIVLATARKLVEEVRVYRQDVIYTPNGVEYERFAHLAQGEVQTPPSDLQPLLALKQPIIGYYGALARWFDYDLLKAVAALRPNYTFVLIGPDYDGTIWPANINSFSNIHWLGVKPYSELPKYLYYFNVATIPFVVNEITHAVSPLKLFEYMAGGKPIVITPMQESLQYKGVLVGDTPLAFAKQLDQALMLQNNPMYIEQLRKTARENTWDARAEEILRRIESLQAT